MRILGVFFVLLLLMHHSRPALWAKRELPELLRAHDWEEIKKRFADAAPYHKQASYALALALLNKDKQEKQKSQSKIIRSFRYFFSILDISCPTARDEKGLLLCLRPVKQDSRSQPMEVITAWQAALEAERYEMSELSLGLLEIIRLRKDAFSEHVFQARLTKLIRNKDHKTSLKLITSRLAQTFQRASSYFLRARAFAYAKKKKLALSLYFKAAYKSKALWLRREIWHDLEFFYPDLFSSEKYISYNKKLWRNIISLSDVIPKSYLSRMQSVFKGKEIVQSSNSFRLQGDALYLIAAKNMQGLRMLRKSFHSYLRRNLHILAKCASQLHSMGEYKESLLLLSPFRSSLPKHSDLWYSYLQALEEQKGARDPLYFRELLAYVQVYPHHIRTQDLLMKSLLGQNAEPDWAPDDFWEKAHKQMPHSNSSGRFFYWLGRYYAEKKKRRQEREIMQNFYYYAPGSMYAQEAWKNSRQNPNPAKWNKAWTKVTTSADYLKWISRYGSSSKARRFLSLQKRHRYTDPKAKAIWSSLQKSVKLPGRLIPLLFQLGEWEFATRLFRERYRAKLNRSQYLLRLVRLGRASKTLNVQIYYLRRLLYKEGVAIDPFRLGQALNFLLYPRPHRSLVRSYGKNYGIEESISYALMRQESLFRENAISRTGAQGLMQIMPATGKWLADRIFPQKSLAQKASREVFQPMYNIRFGIYYFSELLEKYERNFCWAAIAYNGGPGNLRKWRKQYYKEGDFYYFLERLPIQESRNYCRFTYENYMHYSIIYH